MKNRPYFFLVVGICNSIFATVNLLLYLHFNKPVFGALSMAQGTIAIICYLVSLALILE